MNYIQCKLKNIDGRTTVGYVPEYGAFVGAMITMLCEDWEPKKFDNGWTVVEVYTSTKHPEEFVKEHERDYKKFDY